MPKTIVVLGGGTGGLVVARRLAREKGGHKIVLVERDPVYRFDDLDEFVRGATFRGSEVMLTIWGTPSWANGGKGLQFLPTKLTDLTAFSRALADRYDGTRPGFPFVRYYTVWNESNRGQFLSPQFDAKGKLVAPSVYARLYRAAYAGIKGGNPRALVGTGETASNGRDRPTSTPGLQQTSSPGKFAELLAKERPKIKFDGWSLHPYPTSPGLPPTQQTRWPNVTLNQLQRFGTSLDTWFKRKDTPIWITEYAHETKPGEPSGVTYSQQRSYAQTALTIARHDPRVRMFIWFILRDDPTSTWQSGLIERDGSKKPAFGTFSALAHLLDGRNPILSVKSGQAAPTIRISALELYARSGPGAIVGMNVRVLDGTSVVVSSQPQTTIDSEGWVTLTIPFQPPSGRSYRVEIEVVDASANRIVRTVTLNGV